MSDDVSDLLEKAFDLIRDLQDGHAKMEARHERMFRYGKILDASDINLSDPENPVARIHHDDDENNEPVKGPFVRYMQIAGARNQHNPPSVGQQFLHLSPDGEMEAGILIPLGPSQAFPAPSTEAGTYVDGTGQTDVRFKDGKHQVKAGDKTAHLVTDKGQRIQVEDLSKLIIKVGKTAMMLKPDVLVPAQDIEDF